MGPLQHNGAHVLIVGHGGRPRALAHSMWAAGLSAYDMARFSLSWRPEDYIDVQWRHLPRFAVSALRGFTGLAKGEAVQQLFEERMRGMAVGDTASPSRRSSTTWTSAASSTSARGARPS